MSEDQQNQRPPERKGWWASRWDRQTKSEKVVLSGLGLLFVIAAFGGAISPDPSRPVHETPSSGTQKAALTSSATPARPSLIQRMQELQPVNQRSLIEASEAGQRAVSSASNDMQKGGARRTRMRALCDAVPSRTANRWVGMVDTLSSNSDGKGVLSIKIAPKVYVKTWNNAVSDIYDQTLIDPDSTLFQRAAELKKGDPVVFSGRFFKSATDCINESSMTLDGSMGEPEYIFRFSEIGRLDP